MRQLNYIPFFAGAPGNDADFKIKQTEKLQGKSVKREVWLWDIAEYMKMSTLFIYGGCHKDSVTQAHDSNNLQKDANYIELGGCQQQYMMDTENRPIADYVWPSALHCESKNRKILKENILNSKFV